MLMRSTSPLLKHRQVFQGLCRSAGTTRRRSLQLLWSAITFVAIVFGAAPQAQAHDAVVASTPADGATVSSFPRAFELEFSGIPQQSFNTVAVSDAQSGEVLFTVEPNLDQQFVRFETPAEVHPDAGEYIIGFQITSSDGHATRGKLRFTVSGADATSSGELPQSASTSDQTAESNDGGKNLVLILIGAAVLCAIAVAAIAFRAKNDNSPTSNQGENL